MIAVDGIRKLSNLMNKKVIYKDVAGQIAAVIDGETSVTARYATAACLLNEAFDYFKANSAEELVLDLRYNGGGSTYISNQLAGLITGNIFQGEIYSKTFHNESKTNEDFTEAFYDQSSAYGFQQSIYHYYLINSFGKRNGN